MAKQKSAAGQETGGRNNMAMTLEDYLQTHRETIRPWVLVKQLVPYQKQYAENHAILGDKLLDVYFYQMEKLLDKESDVTDDATHRRSEILSNRSLASFGNAIFEFFLEPEQWRVLSEKERGTFVEAVVGACFHVEGLQFSDQFEVVMRDLIERLQKAAESREIRNPISLVLEWLQAHRIIKPEERFQTKEIGRQSFQTTIEFERNGESCFVTGPTCPSIAEAKRRAAALVMAELGLGEAAPTEIRRVEAPAPAETGVDLVRVATFNQALERERWDLQQTLDWFQQKCKTDPDAAPFLLRAQLDNAFEVIGWVGKVDELFVAIMTSAFSGERHWSFGVSEKSRRQSMLAAGKELIRVVPFEDWIGRIFAK